MLGRNKISLNIISQEAAVSLIQSALNKNINVRKVFVDTVGPPDKYQSWLSTQFSGIEFTVASKADSKFPCVSAASIVAKVNRDRIINNWVFKESYPFNRDFGCGYPSDPITRKWLANSIDPVFGFPSLVRFSWKTTKDLITKRGKLCSWENYEEDDKGKPVVIEQIPRKRNNYYDNNDVTLNVKFI
jgi:ribonuclease H2 subunit A